MGEVGTESGREVDDDMMTRMLIMMKRRILMMEKRGRSGPEYCLQAKVQRRKIASSWLLQTFKGFLGFPKIIFSKTVH